MKGEEISSSDKRGVVNYSKSNFTGTNGNLDIQANEGPIKDAINSYKIILDDYKANVIDISIITLDELKTLGCTSTCCPASVPSWVYQTSYWTRTMTSGWIYGVHTRNQISSGYAYYTDLASSHNWGVRPVITISVEEFK